MKIIPDLTGFIAEDAVTKLENLGIKVIVLESYGKNTIKTNHKRVIRQKMNSKNEVEFVISFF
ncbi:hypothetical protein [Alkaliphilus peptidifermentans]|uniref:PASTA domain-containing protein n=1 Tax=Alkaliphilus peptidifermentans DSM 18978 TaxID=1120976 RepID=A0A1G5DDL7_9FIRM|nr:hypothetical protein [Alkaliphilus peptidifermentans]SCY12929.1 hypothetical protein SAMN03080606_00880 [Alkaliphilus peptidifermentans DSM 18978]